MSNDEAYLEFDIPKNIKDVAKTPIYLKGTGELVGTAEFYENKDVKLYVREDIFDKVREDSIEVLGIQIMVGFKTNSYSLGTIDLDGKKEGGAEVVML